MKDSVFLSYPKPYLEKQKQFIEKVVSYLENRGLQPRTLGVTDYDMDAPLTAIRRLLLESNGLIAIAFRRSLIVKGTGKPDSDIGENASALSVCPAGDTTSVRTLPEDKWIIAENAHAAIVTKDEYYQAQKAIRNVTPIQYKVGDDFALKGKICCGNCNRQLRHERQYGEMVFYCGYKRSAGKFSKCYGGYYREYSVNAKVARAIKTVFYALDVVNQGMQKKQSITVRCMDIEDLEKQAEAIRVEQIKLYESYADGVLLRDAYIEKKKALSEKLAALQDSIRTEKEEQECADELDEEIRALTKQASEKTYIGGLTKECVDAFVSMVYLYDDQTMKIEFNCEDVIRRALEKYGV